MHSHKNTNLPCRQEADDGQRTALRWWCHQVCVLQLAVRWIGQSRLDRATPKLTELAADKASSWSVKVTKEKTISNLLLRAVTGIYSSEKHFSWPWQELVAQSFLKIDDFNIFPSSDLSFCPSDFKAGPSLQQLRQVQQCNLGNSKEIWAKSHWLT